MSQPDKSGFSEGNSQLTAIGGVYNETLGTAPVEDSVAAVRITSERALHVSLRDGSGGDVAALPTAIRHGQVSVGTSAVQLTAGALKQGVTIKAPSTNSGKLFVGVTGVTTSTGFPLSAGDAVFLAVDNVNRIYVISDTTSQNVAFLGS